MKHDPGSNYTFMQLLSDADLDAGTVYSSVIDHGVYGDCATALITTLIACTTCVATVQTSALSGSDFADQTSDGSGNDVSVDIGVNVGTYQLDIPNPLKRYSRVKLVTTGDNSAAVITACVGPKRNVVPADTTTRTHP